MVSSSIGRHPVLTVQSALYFTFLANLFNQPPSQLIWEASNHATINARRQLIHMSNTVYCQVLSTHSCPRFNIAAQDSNAGSPRVQSSTREPLHSTQGVICGEHVEC